MSATSPVQPRSYLNGWFVPNDIDGFFGLFVDNLCQMVVIVGLCSSPIVGMPLDFVVGRILPGIAVSLVAGNLFYAWQARRLSQKTGKPVTALPFGVNTVSLFAFIFLILGPVAHETKDNWELAWKVSLAAGFLGGLIEIATSFFGAWVRRHTPRAALLSALAGVGITFISMGFIFQIFSSPLIAVFPAILVLIGYAGRVRWPLGIPTGLLAVLAGSLVAWLLRFSHAAPTPEWPKDALHLYLPIPIVGEVLSLLTDPHVWSYSAIFIPMAILNVIGSIQNLESAEAAGDKFNTQSSLLTNGISAVVGVFFGNPFAPTIYIGHPGWKAMGARSGYSVLNAIAITAICLTGAMPFVLYFMPQEVTYGILLWIGIIITAQAFQEVPKAHATAVAIGFIPSIAAWAVLLLTTALRIAAPGFSLEQAAAKFTPQIFLNGMISLDQGFIYISIIFSAVVANVIDRRWRAAGVWCLIASASSAIGLIHAFVFTPDGYAPAFFAKPSFGLNGLPTGLDYAVVYACAAVVLFALHIFNPPESEH
jgi:AGZA family xanthine/uracil permease-like MFS transporter